jgi:ribonuclease HII
MARHAKTPHQPDLTNEITLQQTGLSRIAGLDEAGRGAWAGPVMAAAVMLPLERANLAQSLEGVRDSKQMTATQREIWASCIHHVAITVGLGVASAREVDKLGLITATRVAMVRALDDLCEPPEHLLIDYMLLPDVPLPQTALTRGDARTLSVAAASVVAKVTRDQAMVKMDTRYPGYGFDRNKGYGTHEHRAALKRLGPCPTHRRSYKPVALFIPTEK